jgi:hypothetical protein
VEVTGGHDDQKLGRGLVYVAKQKEAEIEQYWQDLNETMNLPDSKLLQPRLECGQVLEFHV